MASLISKSKQRPRSVLAEYTYNLMTAEGPDLGCLNDYAIDIIEIILKDFYRLENCGYYLDIEKKQIIIHTYDKNNKHFIFRPKKDVALKFLESKLNHEYSIRFANKEDMDEQIKRF